MMDGLKTWIIGITVASMLLGAADTMVTQRGIRRVLRLAGGILLIAVLLGPLSELAGEDPGFSVPALSQEARELEEQFAQEQQTALAGIIEEEVAAYISDKARFMGVSGEVSVETETAGEGVPLPSRVRIRAPYHQELSRWMAEELGLPEECQIWQEE